MFIFKVMMNSDFQKKADFKIGEIVKHRLFSFRGVIFDVDLSL